MEQIFFSSEFYLYITITIEKASPKTQTIIIESQPAETTGKIASPRTHFPQKKLARRVRVDFAEEHLFLAMPAHNLCLAQLATELTDGQHQHSNPIR
jgi:hypothetical protein